jgi:hypothetical protein
MLANYVIGTLNQDKWYLYENSQKK